MYNKCAHEQCEKKNTNHSSHEFREHKFSIEKKPKTHLITSKKFPQLEINQRLKETILQIFIIFTATASTSYPLKLLFPVWVIASPLVRQSMILAKILHDREKPCNGK